MMIFKDKIDLSLPSDWCREPYRSWSSTSIARTSFYQPMGPSNLLRHRGHAGPAYQEIWVMAIRAYGRLLLWCFYGQLALTACMKSSAAASMQGAAVWQSAIIDITSSTMTWPSRCAYAPDIIECIIPSHRCHTVSLSILFVHFIFLFLRPILSYNALSSVVGPRCRYEYCM